MFIGRTKEEKRQGIFQRQEKGLTRRQRDRARDTRKKLLLPPINDWYFHLTRSDLDLRCHN